jgi:hypothetical protein
MAETQRPHPVEETHVMVIVKRKWSGMSYVMKWSQRQEMSWKASEGKRRCNAWKRTNRFSVAPAKRTSSPLPMCFAHLTVMSHHIPVTDRIQLTLQEWAHRECLM